MPLTLVVLAFIFGIFLCIKGANLLVFVASKIQSLTGISEVTLGLTLMSVITTLPETVVAVMAAAVGEAELAVGSSVGSMAFNLAVVLAVYLFAQPVAVERKQILWKSLFLFLALGALLLFALNQQLGLWECLALCVSFVIFLLASRPAQKTPKVVRQKIPVHLWVVLLVGAAMLTLGAFLIVSYSEVIGAILSIPKNIMAIVLVAVGISLPEFFIAIMAVCKKQGGMALGNIIGSCIINATLVLGIVGLIAGNLLISASTLMLSLPFLLLASLIALVPLLIWQRTNRLCGYLLVMLYVLYIISLYM